MSRMSKVVSLPFFIPTFATYHNGLAGGLVFGDSVDGELQMMNQSIGLICSNDFLYGRTTPDLLLPDTSWSTFPNILKHFVHLKYAEKYFHYIIHDSLDDHAYVVFAGFDDYYLPGKSWYGIRHMDHDGVICGYDDEEGIYEVAAYDIDWNLRIIKISQKAFEESMNKAFELGYSPVIISIKQNSTKIELNLKAICAKLKKYLNSDIKKYPPEKKGLVYDFAVHDYMVMYMDKLIDGSIDHEKMDWRIVRAIWEYRVCMCRRLEIIEEKLNFLSEASEEFSKVVEEDRKSVV